MALINISNTSYADYQAELSHRVESWVKIRFLIAYLLFGAIFFYRPSLSLPFPVVPVISALLLIVICNCFSLIALSYRRNWAEYLAYAQVGIDFIIITIVYQITGGIDSPFDWLYLYVIVTAGLVGALPFSIGISFLSLASSGLVLWAQYNFYLPHYHVGTLATHSLSGFHDLGLIVSELIANGVMYLSLGLISGYIANLAETRRIKLVEAYQLLKKHNEQVLQAITVTQEDERKRIARELHDETGQSLTVLIANLQMLEAKLAPEAKVQEQIASLRRLAENLLDEVHNIIFDLRPSILDDLGVVASLKWYARNYLQPLGIEVEILITGEEKRLDEEREVVLYRFLQEALSNVIKHARATAIVIMFHFRKRQLQIQVQDNGTGFNVGNFDGDGTQRWGIVGIRERIEMMQGEFQIMSEPGTGTYLSVTIPLMAVEKP